MWFLIFAYVDFLQLSLLSLFDFAVLDVSRFESKFLEDALSAFLILNFDVMEVLEVWEYSFSLI